jgi:hypothetical protein
MEVLNSGDIRVSKWQRILSMISKADIGIKAIPLEGWIGEQIELEKISAERFRKWAYIGKW